MRIWKRLFSVELLYHQNTFARTKQREELS
jgi:hypothetical protein